MRSQACPRLARIRRAFITGPMVYYTSRKSFRRSKSPYSVGLKHTSISLGTFLRTLFATLAAATAAGGCVPATQETLALSCSDYIGKPISARIAAWGAPRTVYRMSPTQVGYIFESKQTAFIGGEPYYTVNYMIGADKHHTPIRKVTTVCSGVFVANAPSDVLPVTEQIVVDIIAQ